MKRLELAVLLTFVFADLVTNVSAQEEQILPEVKISAKTYKYLKAVDNKELAQPVRLMEQKAAAYDVKSSEYYEDDNDTYYISFYLPKGYILAVYDQEGKLLRTAEKYKDVTLPSVVTNAVVSKYPGWAISKDVYLVGYNSIADPKKDYRLTLQKGSKRLRVKLNDRGEFID